MHRKTQLFVTGDALAAIVRDPRTQDVGSLNKDARGMMTDGEVLQVTAGAWAMWAVADTWMLTGSPTWIDTQEELDKLLPPYTQLQRRIGRWVRKVI
jgi:hypothetical protein